MTSAAGANNSTTSHAAAGPASPAARPTPASHPNWLARSKNARQLAERIGDAPDGVQYLIGRADWVANRVCDNLRADVVETPGAPADVLFLDETGHPRGQQVGRHRAATHRHRRPDRERPGVFLAYASKSGTASIDRALDRPGEWTDDPGRCTKAEIPEDTRFATEIQPARATPT